MQNSQFSVVVVAVQKHLQLGESREKTHLGQFYLFEGEGLVPALDFVDFAEAALAQKLGDLEFGEKLEEVDLFRRFHVLFFYCLLFSI